MPHFSSASNFLKVLRYTSENVFVPLTVGGGIRDFTDANGRYKLVLYDRCMFWLFHFQQFLRAISMNPSILYCLRIFWFLRMRKLCKYISLVYFVLRHYSSLEVASEYFRSGADKISIGSDAVYAAEEYLRTKVSPICYYLFT